ncbi:DNA adenine methylase [Curtobacterium oceanosedimentum]|uniref:DNA adenine methylase n=1 Tax=Curtobacterium oceanosedimentum TaxID=465820 RepID=UPI0033944586
MGSKFRLVNELDSVFSSIPTGRALDAFSGSGIVSYLLKSRGWSVVSNDFMEYPSVVARALIQNSRATLDAELTELICSPAADDRDFITRTFEGIFFERRDLEFLDAAWSHIDRLQGATRDVAIAALVIAAARRQPRGVFTFVGHRYDDGRRHLRVPIEDLFREAVAEVNGAIFDNGRVHRVLTQDSALLSSSEIDLVYLDPPYAPPKDDADYMKRYHFLEGLSVYWRGQVIMEETKTKKIAKKFTEFAYKRTIENALERTFAQFASVPTLVMSYSSNAVPDRDRIVDLMKVTRPRVDVKEIPHRYSFGTHSTAARRQVSEYIFIGSLE